MPIYDFQCCKCNKTFEEYLSKHDKPNPICLDAECKGHTERLLPKNTLIDMNGLVVASERRKAELGTTGARIE